MFLATRPSRTSFLSNFSDLFDFGLTNLPKGGFSTSIRENETNFELELPIPGAKKEDFKIFTDKGNLYITYENKQEDQDEEYSRFNYNGLHKSFSLGDNIDVDNIKADYVDGILRLELPKKEVEDTKRHIEIQ